MRYDLYKVKKRHLYYIRADKAIPERLWHELHQDEIDREIARYRGWMLETQDADLASAMQLLIEKLLALRPYASSFPLIGTRPDATNAPDVRAKKRAREARSRANRRRRIASVFNK